MAIDIIKHTDFNRMRLPKLKGHVKVTLHNCRTGKNEVAEGENIVTNAVADIFANNYLGGINTGSLLPIYSKWYGGILVYKEPHTDTTDPTDYFIKGDNVNELIAHAGDTAPSSAQIVAEDLKRGSPLSETNTDNSVTRVWEWGSSQGNGQISALSLTHKDTGNAGTGCNSSAFGAFSPWESIGNLSDISVAINSANNVFAQYDDYHGMRFAIGTDGQYAYGNVRFDTQYLTVYISRLPYAKVGLFDTQNVISTGARQFTVELQQTLKCMPSFYFDYETKQLWIFHNITGFSYDTPSWNKKTINYAVIDCENEELLSEGTIESDATNGDFAPTCVSNQNYRDGNSSCHRFGGIVKEGNFVYIPTSTGSISGGGFLYDFNINMTGYRRIDLSGQASQKLLVFNTNASMHKSAIKNGGLLMMSGRVVNGDIGYACAEQLGNSWGAFTGVYGMQRINKISTCVFPIGAGSGSGSYSRMIFANKMVNTTLFNLNSAVQKTTAKSMQIEYTLTEVSGNE